MLFMSMCYAFTYAQQEVTLKAGTLIPLRAQNTVAAANVKIGDKIPFTVSRDVQVGNITAIPYGTLASGIVTEAKKSKWWGTKGRLGIMINELVMPNGTVIPLDNGNLHVYGQNRTPLSVILFVFVWPACFICGSKAEMQAGYELQTNNSFFFNFIIPPPHLGRYFFDYRPLYEAEWLFFCFLSKTFFAFQCFSLLSAQVILSFARAKRWFAAAKR